MNYEPKSIWFLNPSVFTPQISEAIRRFLEFWLPIHRRDDNSELFHYTTIEGLKGIIQNRSLWFSHTSSLNDPSELNYGKDLIIEEIKGKINAKHEGLLNQFLNSLIDNVNMFSNVMYETYIACFCESPNLLSQWRGYGESRDGFNIGFDFKTETKFCHSTEDADDDVYIILRKVQYKLDEQKALVDRYISSLISYGSDAISDLQRQGEDYSHWPQVAAMEASNLLFDLMFSFKNHVFKEENEWRLIISRSKDFKPDKIQFRKSKSNETPYLETYIYDAIESERIFPVRSIKMGPTVDIDSTKSLLELFIRKETARENNIKLKTISISDAGYVLRV